MRIAIVSDVHGNLAALEAVLADLRETSPDLILQGGDLADGGSNPAQAVDRIRDLGWPGVLGNTDEMHSRPESLEEFASASSAPASMWDAVREMAAWTREKLGEERIAWLRGLPRVLIQEPVALVHASPSSPWRSPGAAASEPELQSVYASLGQPIAVYGHIHQPFVRSVRSANGVEILVANAGAVSMSYDGDYRASYLLLDGLKPFIRRVEYDLKKELDGLRASGLPHSDWIERTLLSGSPQAP
jgi:predicted phosphodiesterase